MRFIPSTERRVMSKKSGQKTEIRLFVCLSRSTVNGHRILILSKLHKTRFWRVVEGGC